MPFRAVVMKFVGLQLSFWGGVWEDVGDCLRFQVVMCNHKKTVIAQNARMPTHAHNVRSCTLLPTNSDPACSESFSVPLQDNFIPTNSLLWWLNISPVQGINYWAVEHHKEAWLGAGAGKGACLPGWPVGSAAAFLAVMCRTEEFQDSSVPSPVPEESREVLRGLAKGSPGWASEQLPLWLQWMMELLREGGESPHHFAFLPLSLSVLRLAALTRSLNNTASQ